MSWILAACGWLAVLAVAGLASRSHASLLEAMARTCHELRGPLTAARLGLALGGGDAALAAPRVRAIDLELERAGLAIDDLDRLSRRRLRPGTRCPAVSHLEDIDLRALVARSAEAIRGSAASHGARVRLRPDAPAARVRADRLRLAQAVGNLLSNAVEHGGGDIEIVIGRDRRAARVEITDSGPGLPAPVAELARRPRAGRGRRGRGLAIACAIADEHGGRLAAAPSDRGARIVLELPLEDSADGRPSEGDPAPAPSEGDPAPADSGG